jgi:hypothetical protein
MFILALEMNISSESGSDPSSESDDFDLMSGSEEGIEEICLLCENPQEIMFQSFVSVLETHLETTVWPGSDCYHSASIELYRKKFEKKTSDSVLSIVFLTDKFVKSKESMKSLEFSKSIKKPLIVLVVNEIENYEEIKSTILTDCLFICEIFKARVNKFGFDQYLWTSGYFKTLITKILDIFQEDIVIIFLYSSL